MRGLAVGYRALQLLAHNGHSLSVAAPMFADRAFFGELLRDYAGAYDAVMERLAGEGAALDLTGLQLEAVAELVRRAEGRGDSAEGCFQALLEGESCLCALLEGLSGPALMGTAPGQGAWVKGTQALMGRLAEECEVRQFKIGLRIGGEG